MKHILNVGDRVQDSRNPSRKGEVIEVDIADAYDDDGERGQAVYGLDYINYGCNGWSEDPYRIQWDDRQSPLWVDSGYAEPDGWSDSTPEDEPDDEGNYNYQEEPVTATIKIIPREAMADPDNPTVADIAAYGIDVTALFKPGSMEFAKPKVKAYLAGPMRGIKEFNFPRFLAVGRELEQEWGFEVFNPAQHDIDRGFDFSGYDGTEDLSDTGFDLRQSLGDDLEFVAREADLVVVLDGWEKSKGARAEVSTALALGIPVVRYDDLQLAETIAFAPKITEIPPLRDALWEPVTNHVARNPAADIPCYIVSGKPTGEGEDGPEFQEGDVVDVYSFSAAEGEVRSVSSTGAEKGTKIERFDLLPTQALAQIARHYGVGAAKYAPNNWRKGYEWSKSYAALQRHLNAFWGGEDYDEETGSPHLAAAGFHVLTLLTYMDEQPGFDDRWKGNDD